MSAHPKIQKMCEEESDDHEAVAKLFEINDSINRTIERYRLVRNGDLEAAAKIPKGTLGTSGAGVSRGANNELSLIDLGGPDDESMTPEPSSNSAPEALKSSGNALADDLLGLSMTDNYGQGGAVSLGSNGFGMFISIADPAWVANIGNRSSTAFIRTSSFKRPNNEHVQPIPTCSISTVCF
jgi:ADP-ribosylation factor-binding protein GGA